MYVHIETNLLYQLERIALNDGRSVADLVNEVLYAYVDTRPDAPQAALQTPSSHDESDHGAA